jgi:O-acetyl-ADP-ribose deacetylase (regulator of RNase III)
MALGFNIILGDKSPDQVDAWHGEFAGVEEVTVRGGNLLLTKADALVSPANSFGFMDGGIDWAISDLMRWTIQPIVQKVIREKHFGELLVGQAEIVATGNDQFPYLVCAPTMRVPQPVPDSLNAFLAMRAILLAVKTFNQQNNGAIKSVAIPGLATGFGKMPPERCARQMREAYNIVDASRPVQYKTLKEAIRDEIAYKA